MPTPQSNLIFVEQASCLFLKMVKNVSKIKSGSIGIIGRN